MASVVIIVMLKASPAMGPLGNLLQIDQWPVEDLLGHKGQNTEGSRERGTWSPARCSHPCKCQTVRKLAVHVVLEAEGAERSVHSNNMDPVRRGGKPGFG